jgi:hypothetical protein
VCMQSPTAAIGKLGTAIGPSGPLTAPGEADLTQALGGKLETATGSWLATLMTV